MTRLYPLGQLLLARLREFYREPETIFWVYGFPLLLPLAGGASSPDKAPPPPPVDVQGSPDQSQDVALAKLLTSKGLPAEIHTAQECKDRLAIGKTALYVVAASNEYRLFYDNTR